ncbi:ABC transporter permease [soil metagenome]
MPEWAGEVRRRLSTVPLSPTREAEVVDELSQHLEEHYRELIAGGASAHEAERLTLAEFRSGNVLARYMATLRQAHPPLPITPGDPALRLFHGLRQDLRYSVRMLRTHRAFTAAAVLTLALGIGVNAAIFALVDATLLRPLPLPAPERLVSVFEHTEQFPRGLVAPANLLDWNARAGSFERIAGHAPNVASMVLGSDAGAPETIPRQWVTSGIFDVLGVQPVVGRTFTDADDASSARVVVLNEPFWRTRFNADPGIVGQGIRLDGELWTVVGVVSAEAEIIGRSSIWAMRPISVRPTRSFHGLSAVGRLEPGVSLEAARAEIAAVAAGLAKEYPQTNTGRGVTLEPLRDTLIGGDLRQTAMLFLGVVGFVLIICCGNVANLLLTRAAARKRELALRSALGAGRGRIIRQLLTESLVLSIAGGALGLAFGALILDAAPSLIPAGLLPATVTLALDARVVAFCAGTAILVGLLFGLAPAWQATGIFAARAIAAHSRTSTARGGLVRTVLVAGQVATAVVLLVGAGLLLRTLMAVQGVDRGYGADQVLTMMVDPPGLPSLLQFYDSVEQEVLTIPAVESVGWATTLPLGESYLGSVAVEVVGEAPAPDGQRHTADYQIVSPFYFRTIDLPIVAGRAFDDRDVADRAGVCIVNEAFVARYVNGRSPIGRQVAISADWAAGSPPPIREIVGVARQVKGSPDETHPLAQIYVPLAQDPTGDIFMLLRAASGQAESLAPAVRAAIARVDKAQLVSVRDVMTLDGIVAQGTARHRFRAVLVVVFAGLALVLAMVGLFGVLAYMVQQRVREFGVRRALGATTGDVLRQVGRAAVPMIASGAAVGLVLALLLARLIASMLFGVRPLDGVTYGAVAGVVMLTAAVAMAAPAWRATRVDPAIALRHE